MHVFTTIGYFLAISGACLAQQPPNYEIPNTPFPQQRFKSSNATAPVLQIRKNGAPLAPGLLFFQPQLRIPALIMKDNGDLVWCGPAEPVTNDQAQILFGKPVLTRWTGLLAKGIGYGQVKILDTTYKEIYSVCPKLDIYAPNAPVPPQCHADTHELTITDRNTVVVTAWNVTRADLTSVGGPANGWIIDTQFYDLDVTTGKPVFSWKAYDHIPLTKSQKPINGTGSTPQNPYDPYHLNSVQPLPKGYYLANMRYTSGMYLVNPNGGVELEFNGINGGDFGPLPAGGQFAFQHHARVRDLKGSVATITFFNNDNSEVRMFRDQSTGLSYQLDLATKKATLLRRLVDPSEPYYAKAQGSYDILSNGNVLLDYGQEPVFKEYGPNGNNDVRMTIIFSNTTSNGTYRAYRREWHATPYYPPSLYVDGNAAQVYTSWNGATEVSSYRLFGGTTSTNLKPIANFTKSGFETSYKLSSYDSGLKYFQVAAYDSASKELGRSQVTQAS